MSNWIICGAANHAMILATIKFSGRNWRRIKREQNKAWRKARALAKRH